MPALLLPLIPFLLRGIISLILSITGQVIAAHISHKLHTRITPEIQQ